MRPAPNGGNILTYFSPCSCGCFLKWWFSQNTPKWSFLVGKPMVVGYHFRKRPCGHILDPMFVNNPYVDPGGSISEWKNNRVKQACTMSWWGKSMIKLHIRSCWNRILSRKMHMSSDLGKTRHGYKWMPKFVELLLMERNAAFTTWYGKISHYLQGLIHPSWFFPPDFWLPSSSMRSESLHPRNLT